VRERWKRCGQEREARWERAGRGEREEGEGGERGRVGGRHGARRPGSATWKGAMGGNAALRGEQLERQKGLP
jgi:hypothetical protein